MFDKTPKIRVDIINNGVLESTKKYPIEGSSVIIRKAKRGRGHPEYRAKFSKDCFVQYYTGRLFWRKLRQKLVLLKNADECVKFHREDVELAMWDREAEERLFDAGAIRNAGATLQKLQISPFLYVAVFGNLAISFIVLLFASGQVRM